MINIGGGIALVKKTIFSYTASKGFFWTLAFGWMVPPMVFMYVWSRAAGVQGIGGYDADRFITYYLALILINQFTYPSSHWTVGQAVLSGGYNHILLRPMPPIFEAISSDLALKLICLPFVILFVVVLGISQPAFVLALGKAPLWAVVTSVSFAMILRFSFGYALGE
jgi:ABC-2 type transport system permease protein